MVDPFVYNRPMVLHYGENINKEGMLHLKTLELREPEIRAPLESYGCLDDVAIELAAGTVVGGGEVVVFLYYVLAL